MINQVNKCLHKASSIIQRDGFWQLDKICEGSRSVCMMLAIRRAIDENLRGSGFSAKNEIEQACYNTMKEKLHTDNLACWNDTHTKEEVVAALNVETDPSDR